MKLLMRFLAVFAVLSFFVLLLDLYVVKQPMKGALMLSDLFLLYVWIRDEEFWKAQKEKQRK
ncbi:hypothetical protein [Pantoea dispersa]|uniref:hypothetical protein n=1 Tax=Pantoea dispersa TaxID=59814 RepID=UPI0021C8C587|nr:hypothetical protein [Pantoea dispersa]